MKLIVGLGNPGEKYESTRHNIGFMATSLIAKKHSIEGKTITKFNAIVGKGVINSEEILIAQPLTYMNLSGEALYKIMNFYKLEPKDILIVFDDLSIDLGRIRFRANGSDGGHNGIKSIANHLKTQNFDRLKVGIGPQPPMIPSERFVLQKFQKEELELVEKSCELTTDAIELYLKEGIDEAQNKFNGINVQ